MESITTAIQGLMKTDKDFSQQLKERLVLQSNNVTNPYKFIAGLLTGGVLTDESSDPEAVCGLKGMMVQLAITIASSKGADAVGGLIKALDGSGNSQMVAALCAWAKKDFGIVTDVEFSEPNEDASALSFPPTKKLPKNMTGRRESSSSGTKLIDKIMSRVEDDFIEELQGRLVSKASEILHATQFCKSLVHQNVLEETDMQLATGQEVEKGEGQRIVKAIKVACSKKAIGSLVVALQSTNNELILKETCDWLQLSEARKKNYPIAVKSLDRQRRATATGLFAATSIGLISLDLRTLETTGHTVEHTLAVAVNQQLKKVYWSEGEGNSSIMRSNFDGSAKEVIVPHAGDWIKMLAIDGASGNVYFALERSHEIAVCDAFGKNRTKFISSSLLVNLPYGFAVDSEKGVVYWGNRGSAPHSLVRAKLDGSGATTISTEFNNLLGLILEQPSNDVIYYADFGENIIGTLHVYGGPKRRLVELQGYQGPSGIQVDAKKIYIGNFRGRNIQSVDRYSGAELTMIFDDDDLFIDLG